MTAGQTASRVVQIPIPIRMAMAPRIVMTGAPMIPTRQLQASAAAAKPTKPLMVCQAQPLAAAMVGVQVTVRTTDAIGVGFVNKPVELTWRRPVK